MGKAPGQNFMYTPESFRQDDLNLLHQLMRARPLAALVTLGSQGLVASHLPMLFDGAPEPWGALCGHLSKANPQWKDFIPTVPALAIFNGVDHYITPSWYPSKKEHGRVVPTWNYAVVHVYGQLEIIDNRDWLLRHVRRMTETHEARFPKPWGVDDAPAAFVEGVVNGIVGIRLIISSIEGKWKLNQNRPQADRAGVIAGLHALGDPESMEMAELMDPED